MRAAVLEKLNAPLVIKELQIPKLEYGQVLVRVHASGICGAQIGEITGAKGEDKYLPHLLGHEGGGVVVEIGEGVSNVIPGDRVVLHWRKGIGIEAAPPKYIDEHGNVIGGGWVTTFNEFAVVSENRLTLVPNDTPFDIAALMGCAVTTGLGIVYNEAQLQSGQTIAIAGCGGVGLNVIQGAALVKASRIIAIDIQEEKGELAKHFGATETMMIQGQSIKDIGLVDVFVDCTGNVNMIAQGYAIAKKTILVGQPHIGQDLLLPNMRQNYCGKILMDSRGGLTNPGVDIPLYLKMYKAGMLNLDDLITDRFPLLKVNQAIKTVRTNCLGRCILGM